jgi:hypothetical protein
MFLFFQPHTSSPVPAPPKLALPPELPKGLGVTPVFETFWVFAAERQEVFFRRLAGGKAPWTQDQLLQEYKFTNVYRASDRVSQYLIRNVIGSGSESVEEVFFRILLFKIFNKIETWELLLTKLNEISWASYCFQRYDTVLSEAMERGSAIYSGAYIMPSGGRTDRKHRFHLSLLQLMMDERVPIKIQKCATMKQAFELLRAYPSIGDFLAYQFLIDLNYSELLNFDEMDFVKAGPGAKDGMKKCFLNWDPTRSEDIMRWMVDTQEAQFERVGVCFRNLWGRRLHLIDCQNLFCEVDKYARKAHPEFSGLSGRVRIKQRFEPKSNLMEYSYPPKWGINDDVGQHGAGWAARNGTFIAAD